MKNSNLSKAKAEKNDEFYTRLEDIELELSHYPERYFRDKIIYLPCDVVIEGTKVPKSNFVKYFQINRARLGYKKLIATSINNEKNLYMLEQDGTEFNGYCPEDSEYVSGDYRSEYCQKLFKEADVVVTNPPFSLFRDFVEVLEKYNLKYCIIGTMNAITCKEIFPLIKENKMWWGASLRGTKCSFIVPEEYEASNLFIEDGIKKAKINNAIWFTNMDISKRHEEMILIQQYDAEKYLRYDNYDAINVDKLKDIPCDYDGVMGVPITFIDRYNPEQFDILGLSASWCETEEMQKIKTSNKHRHNPIINGKEIYRRVLIRRKQQEVQ